MTKIIGLTGGIGSGKSLVANQFAALGAPIIDTDQIARDLVKPGSPALDQIIQKFGDAILHENGTLNRGILRQRIFHHLADKLWLEALLHPLIRKETIRQAEQITAPYCIIVIPLLFESQHHYPIDLVVVVDTTEEQQIARITARDSISREDAQAIINCQTTRKTRLQGADVIIENNGGLEALQAQIEALHATWYSTKAP